MGEELRRRAVYQAQKMFGILPMLLAGDGIAGVGRLRECAIMLIFPQLLVRKVHAAFVPHRTYRDSFGAARLRHSRVPRVMAVGIVLERLRRGRIIGHGSRYGKG